MCTIYVRDVPQSLAGPTQVLCKLNEELWTTPAPRMSLDAARTSSNAVDDLASDLEFGEMATSTVGSVNAWDLDDNYFQHTGGHQFTVGQHYAQCTWIIWTSRNHGWATVFRGSQVYAVIVRNDDQEVGVWSDRNDGWRPSGYKIKRDTWQFLCAVGEGESSTSFYGTTTFFVGSLQEPPQRVGTSDRVVSGTQVYHIGNSRKGPGKIASLTHWQRAFTDEQIQENWIRRSRGEAVLSNSPATRVTLA